MLKNCFMLIILAGITMMSCMDNPRQTDKEPAKKETVTGNREEIIKREFKNSDGNTLEIIFNNIEDVATVIYSEDSIILKGQKPASGIWYKNNHYELRGKGGQVELKNDGQTIFKN